jgi:hypothetical protein
MPLEKMENGGWQHPARLPLGGGWTGHCTAPGHEASIPSQKILETCCNLGYAAACAWSPADRAWDAVRFSVVAPAEAEKRRKQNRGQAPRTILLHYVCERNHRPVTQGELEYDPAGAIWLRCHDDPRMQKMAECFLDSYLEKRVRGDAAMRSLRPRSEDNEGGHHD